MSETPDADANAGAEPRRIDVNDGGNPAQNADYGSAGGDQVPVRTGEQVSQGNGGETGGSVGFGADVIDESRPQTSDAAETNSSDVVNESQSSSSADTAPASSDAVPEIIGHAAVAEENHDTVSDAPETGEVSPGTHTDSGDEHEVSTGDSSAEVEQPTTSKPEATSSRKSNELLENIKETVAKHVREMVNVFAEGSLDVVMETGEGEENPYTNVLFIFGGEDTFSSAALRDIEATMGPDKSVSAHTYVEGGAILMEFTLGGDRFREIMRGGEMNDKIENALKDVDEVVDRRAQQVDLLSSKVMRKTVAASVGDSRVAPAINGD